MRPRPADVLLVSCYELGHSPAGLAMPAAFLERAGYAVSTVDLSVEPFDEDRAREARFVGISVPMHTALKLGVHVAQRIRSLAPRAHICFYGLYAALNADYLLAGDADSVLAGEIETCLVDRVSRVFQGSDPTENAVHVALEKLSFPVPRRTGLPALERYARLERGGRTHLAGYTEASRGCLHRCRHCPIPPVYGGRFFVVPVETVLADVRHQVEAGARHVTFGDPDFLNGPGHALRIARALRDTFPGVTFDFTAKIEHLLKHRKLLGELAECGCLFIISAVESLSETVLEELDKGHSKSDVVEVLELTRRAGITLRPTWVPFTPWTTREDYLEMLEWIASEDLIENVDPVQLAIRLLVPPGSLLSKRASMAPFLGPLEPESLTYRWTHPDPGMDFLQQELSRLVERATLAKEAPVEIFGRVWSRAWQAAKRKAAPQLPRHGPIRGAAAPRMTESWFC